jgi:hypothetical protein
MGFSLHNIHIMAQYSLNAPPALCVFLIAHFLIFRTYYVIYLKILGNFPLVMGCLG